MKKYFMQRYTKIYLLIFLAILVFGSLIFYSGSSVLFQGRLNKNVKPLSAYDENTCSDKDGGKNYDEAGIVFGKIGRSNSGSKSDFCNSDAELTEYYCDGKFIKSEKYACENGCSGGACKKSVLNSAVDTLVIVNSDDYNIGSNDIEDIFKIANKFWLQPKTGFKFNIMDIKIVSFTEEGVTSYYQYLNKKYFKDSVSKSNLPEYIVAFDKDGISEVFGAQASVYEFLWLIDSDKGNCSEFPAITPFNKKIGVAVAIIDYGHKFGICGYDMLEGDIVSDVSGGGECKGQNGIACVMKNGYQMCSNLVENFFAKDPIYFTASNLVHELLHSYSENGNFDHFATSICEEAMGEKMKELEDKGVSPPFDTLEQEYAVMCPNIWGKFKNSQQSCD